MTAPREYRAGFDRWGNLWCGTPYWIVRRDVAKRAHLLPSEPGRWSRRERVGDSTPNVKRALRVATKGAPSRVVRTRHSGMTITGGEQVVEVYKTAAGCFIYMDEQIQEDCLRRLPGDVVLYAHKGPVPGGDTLAAYKSGVLVGVMMPIRVSADLYHHGPQTRAVA